MTGQQLSITDLIIHPGLRPNGENWSIQQRFEHWLATTDGATVYRELVRRAKRMRRAGWKRYSTKALIESIRYSQAIRLGPQPDGFRINNVFSSRLARLAMAEHEDLEGFFDLRELRA